MMAFLGVLKGNVPNAGCSPLVVALFSLPRPGQLARSTSWLGRPSSGATTKGARKFLRFADGRGFVSEFSRKDAQKLLARQLVQHRPQIDRSAFSIGQWQDILD